MFGRFELPCASQGASLNTAPIKALADSDQLERGTTISILPARISLTQARMKRPSVEGSASSGK